jgi:ferredoxin
MKITNIRRITQIFFLVLFAWFGVVATFGASWHQLRGWPVNWILQLDPLTGLGTVLTTHKLYWPLAWGSATIALTVIVGRFFCGWLCPFGTIHHFVSYLGLRGKKIPERIKMNSYRGAAALKYFVLAVFVLAALVPLGAGVSLLTGLLDPIPLVTRSFSLIFLPIADAFTNSIFIHQRQYEQAAVIGTIFLTAVGLNLVIPRFYCRFICPAGALFGILDRLAIWRIGKNSNKCTNCKLCDQHCQGGCEPSGTIKVTECILCFNCRGDCRQGVISYQVIPSIGGEQLNPDVGRRGVLLAGIGGLITVPILRLADKTGSNWYAGQVRPPGALEESEFLKRCLKCGQCMRVCPTNVIQPAGLDGGFEAMWTPVLNNRIGTSGCQLACTACGYICPTGAIRAFSLKEKIGVAEFADAGPIKIGTAFFDCGRCLPWALDKPCIVCQENCPVSPKAIYTREYFSIIRNGRQKIASAQGQVITFADQPFKPGQVSTGDYYCRPADQPESARRKIMTNAASNITIDLPVWEKSPRAGDEILIEVRLQRPYIDADVCTGCGVCEHECPVSGLRAVRVTAEGETRSRRRRLLAT